MLDEVRYLANVMRMKRKAEGEKFVLMLGAGASMRSGVPSGDAIMQRLVELGGAPGDEELGIRFDRAWKRLDADTREEFLKPFLEKQPSAGYQKLAELIAAGYFDVVVTFNFDRLLEQALDAAGFTDRHVIVRGEAADGEMERLVTSKAPRCKILKLHGSLRSANYFLFDAAEMRRYPDPIASLVTKLTARNIIICGYAFNDDCVERAFAERGGSIFCVNPKGFPRKLVPLLKDRSSEANAIKAEFDDFFTELHGELMQVATPQQAGASAEARPNPFKFLESYDEGDADAFRGRGPEQTDFFNFLEQPMQVIVIAGPAKAGKTSLVRAGLLPQLDTPAYRGLYVRCRGDIETEVPKCLVAQEVLGAELDLPAALNALGNVTPGRRTVLFLDHFDRVRSKYPLDTQQGWTALGQFLRTRLFAGLGDNVTLVLVIPEEDTKLTGLINNQSALSRLRTGTVICRTFEREEVVEIIQTLASTAKIEFDASIIDALADKFERNRNAADARNRFTLAHIHAICHVLVWSRRVGSDWYRLTWEQSLDALHRAINVAEFLSFADDCDYPASEWLRNMVKIPLHESKEGIAEFVKKHYDDLVPPQQPPRPPRRSRETVAAGGGT